MSRKTQIGWISVGVLLCVFSAVLTLKLRDSNKANAREDDKSRRRRPEAACRRSRRFMPGDTACATASMMRVPSRSTEAVKLQPPQPIDPGSSAGR